MKKIIASILALLMLISVTACGGNDDGYDNTSDSNDTNNDITINENKETDTLDSVKSADTTDVSLFEYEVVDGKMTITDYSGSDEIVVIPDTIEGQAVEVLAEYCFVNNENIKGIRLSDSVTAIEAHSFENCHGLEVLVCGANLEIIGQCAFNFCEKLEYVELGEAVKSLEFLCFSNTSIGRIYIPESTETIDSAFLASSKEEEMVIEGKSGSYAEQYAIENEYTFEAV